MVSLTADTLHAQLLLFHFSNYYQCSVDVDVDVSVNALIVLTFVALTVVLSTSHNFLISKIFTLIFSFLFLSGAEVGRFVTMLRNPSSILKACAAFALLQVTLAT